MTAVGVKIDEFGLPVCNSFQAKILNDQLCYEVDLNRYSNENNIKRELKSGFVMILDYNEDRQVTFEKDLRKEKEESLVSRIVEQDDHQHVTIYLNTVGMKNLHYYTWHNK